MRGTQSGEPGCGGSRPRSQGHGTSSPLTSHGAWSLFRHPVLAPRPGFLSGTPAGPALGGRAHPCGSRSPPNPRAGVLGLPVGQVSFSHFTDGRTKAAQEIGGPGPGSSLCLPDQRSLPQCPPSPHCPPVKHYRDKNPASGRSPDRRHRQALAFWAPLPLLPLAAPAPPCLAPTLTGRRALVPAGPARSA